MRFALQAVGRLRLQLMPLDAATTQAMASAGYHPFLELTLGATKSLLSVLRHLAAKWQQAAPATHSGGDGDGALFVHPPPDCPITLRGVCWGGPDCDGQLRVSSACWSAAAAAWNNCLGTTAQNSLSLPVQ